MDQDVIDFVDRIKTIHGMGPLRQAFEGVAAKYGFTKFAYLGIHLPSNQEDKPLLISTYPLGWTDHYMGHCYHAVDPVVLRGSRSVLPFTWGTSDMVARLHGKQKLLFDEAGEFGIRCGFTVPIHGHGGQFAGLTIASEEKDQPFLKKIQRFQHHLHIIALHYHAQVEQDLCAKQEQPEEVVLTEREVECLMWASQGKSAWEISIILGISRNTVLFHIKNVKRKLGVYTVNQAIVKSIVLQLIQP
jgi:DNA-binding CsgD family transcriptional regulator